MKNTECNFKEQIISVVDEINKIKASSKKNIVICGPKLGDEDRPSEKLRVYSYGAIVAEFGLTESGNISVSFINNDYINDKYLCSDEACTSLKKLISSRGETNRIEVLKNKKYWEYATKAAENKFTRKLSSGCRIKKERNIESRILEMYINNRGNSFCIFDMEFYAPKKWWKDGIIGKPDLICFDGETFGLIELKYNNQSCDNLDRHCDDLRSSCKDKESRLVKELIRRVTVSDYYTDKIMDHEVCKKIIENEISKKPWYGFLFVNDDNSDPLEIIKRSKIETEDRILCVKNIEDIKKWEWTTRSKLGI